MKIRGCGVGVHFVHPDLCLKANQKHIQFSGSQVQVESPALLEKLNVQLQAMNKEGQRINAVQRKLGALINGS